MRNRSPLAAVHRARGGAPAVAFAVLLLVTATAASAQLSLQGFVWSSDGATLAAVEDDGLRVTTVRLVDGASGSVRAELPVDRLTSALGGETLLSRELTVVVGPGGAKVAFGRQGSWALWSVADDIVAPAEALARATTLPAFSPAGDRLAFATDGGLTLLELADQEATRIAFPARQEPWHSWAPDGRYLAIASRDENGAHRFAVVDPLAPEPRILDTAPLGSPIGALWRLDGGALGITFRSADGGATLALCNPDRLYCRALAERNDAAESEIGNDFRLLDDGFLWRPTAGDGTLAFFDTLGRQRRVVLPSGFELLGIPALFRHSHEVVVAVAGGQGAVRLLLAGTRDGTVREIATGTGWPPAALSEALRTWVRPRKDAGGQLAGYVLERIDGTEIRQFEVNGAPVDG